MQEWVQLLQTFGTAGIVSSVAAAVFNHWMKKKDAKAAEQEAGRKAKQEEQTALEKARLEEQENIKLGMLALLHDRIYGIYAECGRKSYASVEDIRNIDYLYQPYHALGGNGTGTELYERVKKMPDKPAESEAQL